ncbi:hypothetical protein CTI12_AA428820 [Artemisia annua]|uniref:RAB6-interacting golgin n=1 Tax=Artemisia annua TaxID=35608 RepID=A0A2U1M0A8_ARTAN|nr:hypothetical protein CTI12_AA428820 [Artemisia annua]
MYASQQVSLLDKKVVNSIGPIAAESSHLNVGTGPSVELNSIKSKHDFIKLVFDVSLNSTSDIDLFLTELEAGKYPIWSNLDSDTCSKVHEAMSGLLEVYEMNTKATNSNPEESIKDTMVVDSIIVIASVMFLSFFPRCLFVKSMHGRVEEETKKLAEIREELEALEDPRRKEVTTVRKRIDVVNKELKPLGQSCLKKLTSLFNYKPSNQKEKEYREVLEAFNEKNKEKAQLVARLMELVTESERVRMKKLEELSKDIESLGQFVPR